MGDNPLYHPVAYLVEDGARRNVPQPDCGLVPYPGRQSGQCGHPGQQDAALAQPGNLRRKTITHKVKCSLGSYCDKLYMLGELDGSNLDSSGPAVKQFSNRTIDV